MASLRHVIHHGYSASLDLDIFFLSIDKYLHTDFTKYFYVPKIVLHTAYIHTHTYRYNEDVL